MTTSYSPRPKSDGFDSTISQPSSQARSNPLSAKVTSVLSSSYADADIRDALALLDKRHVENNAETRRQLRLDIQKEVIESNGSIIREFGHVAEVSLCNIDISMQMNINLSLLATQTDWSHHSKPESRL